MGKNIIFYLLIFGLIFTYGCVKQEEDNIAVRINEYTMSLDEFNQELANSGYSAEGQGREGFLGDLINRKVILQEAERMGLNKEPEFLREIERFWEKTLLKSIIDRKSKQLATEVGVGEDEVRARYDEMVNSNTAQGSYGQAYEQIKWQLSREKQVAAFDDWLKGLHEQTTIEINKELLGISEAQTYTAE
ncbi:MAG: hypothetical protein ABIC18_00360 [Candidatus Omnitrophota bacterium]